MWLYIAPMLSTYCLHLRPCSERLSLSSCPILRSKNPSCFETSLLLHGHGSLCVSQHCQRLIDTERSICLITSFVFDWDVSHIFLLVILFVRFSCVLMTLAQAWVVLGDQEAASPHGGAEGMDGARVFRPDCFQSSNRMLEIRELMQHFSDETGGRWRSCAPQDLSLWMSHVVNFVHTLVYNQFTSHFNLMSFAICSALSTIFNVWRKVQAVILYNLRHAPSWLSPSNALLSRVQVWPLWFMRKVLATWKTWGPWSYRNWCL